MKICMVAAFPPSRRQLNEYSFHVARELRRHSNVELTILADELDEYNFTTGADGQRMRGYALPELDEFNVVRCWKFGSLSTPMRLLNAVRRHKPDVVWFNLVFSSFGTPDNPFAAFAGLSAPALTRAAGFYTHITLHHIIEHVDFSTAGVRGEKLYRIGTDVATRALLRAHSVSVLLSAYRRTLLRKYAARNVLFGTHGTFSALPAPPDLSLRGNPEHRILAIGHWGTYKRLELLIEAFPRVLEKIPHARLVIAGANHHTRPGYWESVRASVPAHLPVEFRGYVPDDQLPALFRSSSVLAMPYDSSTGSSGPAHQACEYGLPIVCADVPDFVGMAEDEDMDISFYRTGDAGDLAEKLTAILLSPETQRRMSEHNYEAGVQMSMGAVVRNYLRWFELHQHKRALAAEAEVAPRLRAWPSRLGAFASHRTLDADLLPGTQANSHADKRKAAPAQVTPIFDEDDDASCGPGLESVG
jgi:glycosyltransferase involved in cell wall biosynthesis